MPHFYRQNTKKVYWVVATSGAAASCASGLKLTPLQQRDHHGEWYQQEDCFWVVSERFPSIAQLNAWDQNKVLKLNGLLICFHWDCLPATQDLAVILQEVRNTCSTQKQLRWALCVHQAPALLSHAQRVDPASISAQDSAATELHTAHQFSKACAILLDLQASKLPLYWTFEVINPRAFSSVSCWSSTNFWQKRPYWIFWGAIALFLVACYGVQTRVQRSFTHSSWVERLHEDVHPIHSEPALWWPRLHALSYLEQGSGVPPDWAWHVLQAWLTELGCDQSCALGVLRTAPHSLRLASQPVFQVSFEQWYAYWHQDCEAHGGNVAWSHWPKAQGLRPPVIGVPAFWTTVFFKNTAVPLLDKWVSIAHPTDEAVQAELRQKILAQYQGLHQLFWQEQLTQLTVLQSDRVFELLASEEFLELWWSFCQEIMVFNDLDCADVVRFREFFLNWHSFVKQYPFLTQPLHTFDWASWLTDNGVLTRLSEQHARLAHSMWTEPLLQPVYLALDGLFYRITAFIHERWQQDLYPKMLKLLTHYPFHAHGPEATYSQIRSVFSKSHGELWTFFEKMLRPFYPSLAPKSVRPSWFGYSLALSKTALDQWLNYQIFGYFLDRSHAGEELQMALSVCPKWTHNLKQIRCQFDQWIWMPGSGDAMPVQFRMGGRAHDMTCTTQWSHNTQTSAGQGRGLWAPLRWLEGARWDVGKHNLYWRYPRYQSAKRLELQITSARDDHQWADPKRWRIFKASKRLIFVVKDTEPESKAL